jgi:hypothetical protein
MVRESIPPSNKALIDCCGRTGARRFRQRAAQIPDDQRADAGDDEHPAPAELRDNQKTRERGDEQRRIGNSRKRRAPTAALQRRHEFGQRHITDDDFGTETNAHDKARCDQPFDRGRCGSGKRRDAEDQEIELVGEAAAEAIAEDAGAPGAHHHARESDRYEPAIVCEIGPPGFDQRRQHSAREIDLERIEKHPGADQPEHAVMKRRDRQAIEPPSGIDCACRHTVLPSCSPRAAIEFAVSGA